MSITGEWFEGRTRKGQLKNVDRSRQVAEAQIALEEATQAMVRRLSDEDGKAVLDRSGSDELESRIGAYLDTRRAADAVAGRSVADYQDMVREQLADEETHHQKNWMSLRSQAVAAQARISGYARRPTGYDAPAPSGRATAVGPVVLAVAVGLIEWYQTANWFSSNLSLYQSSTGGWLRIALIAAISGLLTGIVMATTFIAGRRLKEGVVARNARNAEANATGGGGELFQGVAFTVVAVLFQTVTLAMRFATDTEDSQARGGAIVIGLVSFFGALAVLLWEYSAFRPAPSAAKAIYTREADAATIEQFRNAEQRLQQGIPAAKTKLAVTKLRSDEGALERLQGVALDLGDAKVRAVSAYIGKIREEILTKHDEQNVYEPLDLEEEAKSLADGQLDRLA